MGKLKCWKRSKFYGQPNTKIAWESKDKDHLAIVSNKTMSIPNRLILNGVKTIDSTNSLARTKKLALNYMKKHNTC